MAFVADFAADRDAFGARFPPRTTKKLTNCWGPGPLQLFTRDDVPNQAFFDSDRKTIPDFISFDTRLGLSPEVKVVVEKLEPGLHQFFPVNVSRARGKRPFYRTDGRILDEPYYLFNPGIRIDAVDLEKSEVNIINTPQGTEFWAKPGRWGRVFLRQSAIQGRYIWKGGYQLGTKTFFSDRLVEIYRENKWRGLWLTHVQEI